MIIYLEDPRIWLSLTLGLVLVAAGGTLARWVLRYSYRHKGHPQVQALKLAFVGYSMVRRFFVFVVFNGGTEAAAGYIPKPLHSAC
jgi:hypothetical protein